MIGIYPLFLIGNIQEEGDFFMLIDDAIVEFGFDCKVRKLSAKTVANYQKQLRYIEKYLKEEFQITEVEEIKPYHIKQFLAMMDDRHRKPRYINDLLKVAKTFLNYCKREGYQYFIEDVTGWRLEEELRERRENGISERYVLSRYMASWIPWEEYGDKLCERIKEMADA